MQYFYVSAGEGSHKHANLILQVFPFQIEFNRFRILLSFGNALLINFN
jgi:hypothetical protein